MLRKDWWDPKIGRPDAGDVHSKNSDSRVACEAEGGEGDTGSLTWCLSGEKAGAQGLEGPVQLQTSSNGDGRAWRRMKSFFTLRLTGTLSISMKH